MQCACSKVFCLWLSRIGNDQCILKSHICKGRMPGNSSLFGKCIFHSSLGSTKVVQINISVFIQNFKAVKLNYISWFSGCSDFNAACHVLCKIHNRISCRSFKNTLCRNAVHYVNLGCILSAHFLCIKKYKLYRLPVSGRCLCL